VQPHDRVAKRSALGEPADDPLDRGDVADQNAQRGALASERMRAQLSTRGRGEHALDHRGEEPVVIDARVADGHHQSASPTLERERSEADDRELAREDRDHVLDLLLTHVADAPAHGPPEGAPELTRGGLSGGRNHSGKGRGGNDHRALVVAQAYLARREIKPNRLLRVERRVLHPRIHITTALLLLLNVTLALLLPRMASAATPKWATTAGAPVGPVYERPALPFRSCGTYVCVHARSPQWLPRARVVFDDAWDLAIESMRMGRPLLDGGRGGDPRLDVYVDGDDVAIGRDPLDRTLDRDAAPAFILIDPRLVAAGGCELKSNATRAIVRASAMALDVAETPLIVDGLARRIGELAAPCSDPTFADLQNKPFRAITSSAAGTALFARTLDQQYGQGYGAVVPAVLSMAMNHRGIIVPQPDDELGPAHFHNDVTVFDVLSTSLKDAASSLDSVFLDVATARALHTTPPAWEWVVPVSTLPRRFAIRRGIEPMGMTFVKIDLDVTPKNDGVELDLSWDMGSRFLWHVLKLDSAGKKVGDVPVAPLETTRKITIDVRRLAGVRYVVLEGVNTGDPLRPFHPDEPPSHARGYELGIFPGQ
jgi:hypothetical protein